MIRAERDRRKLPTFDGDGLLSLAFWISSAASASSRNLVTSSMGISLFWDFLESSVAYVTKQTKINSRQLRKVRYRTAFSLLVIPLSKKHLSKGVT